MEVLARGLEEMCLEEEVQWVMQQTERFTERLQGPACPSSGAATAPTSLPTSSSRTSRASSRTPSRPPSTRCRAVRALAHGPRGPGHLVPVQIPRLAMTNRQLEQVADAIISLYRQRDKVPPLEPRIREGMWRDQMRYRWVYSDLEPFEFETYPFVIHTMERIGHLESQRSGGGRSRKRATTPSCCARRTSPSIC